MIRFLTKYNSSDTIKNEMGGDCGAHWRQGRCIEVLVGKPEGKRPLGRRRHRWENNIKMDLQDVDWGGMDWIDLTQDRDGWWAVVNSAMNLRGT
jgi:hypothetical protein